MPNIEFAGSLYNSSGAAVNGATVNLYDRNTTTPVRATTSTNASGYWAISHATEGRFDVELVNGTTTVRIKYDDAFQVEALETSQFRIRNPADTFEYDIVPGAITADRQLNLPLITGTDTISVLGLAQTYSAVKTFSAKPVIGVVSSFTGALDFVGTTSGTVTQTVAAAAGTWTFTLPTSGGTANYVLTTNGSGVGSWAQVSLTAGVTGVLPVANGGTNVSAASITAFNNITGYTAAGATGTTSTNLVFSASPTLTGSPVINATASVGGTWTAAATWTLPAHTLGGTVSGGGQVIDNLGTVYINGTANSGMTTGLTIFQGGADNEILSLASSDVAHGMTALTLTSIYGFHQKLDAVNGGLMLTGLNAATTGIFLRGIGVTDNTTKSTAASAYIRLGGHKKSGTGNGQPGVNANLLVIEDYNGAEFIFSVDQGAYEDIGTVWTNYDDDDDLRLLNSLAKTAARPGNEIGDEFAGWATENKEKLEALDILHWDRTGRGRHFLNMTKHQMLLNGAIRQLGLKLAKTEERLARTEKKLAALPA